MSVIVFIIIIIIMKRRKEGVDVIVAFIVAFLLSPSP